MFKLLCRENDGPISHEGQPSHPEAGRVDHSFVLPLQLKSMLFSLIVMPLIPKWILVISAGPTGLPSKFGLERKVRARRTLGAPRRCWGCLVSIWHYNSVFQHPQFNIGILINQRVKQLQNLDGLHQHTKGLSGMSCLISSASLSSHFLSLLPCLTSHFPP